MCDRAVRHCCQEWWDGSTALSYMAEEASIPCSRQASEQLKKDKINRSLHTSSRSDSAQNIKQNVFLGLLLQDLMSKFKGTLLEKTPLLRKGLLLNEINT